MPAVIHVDRQPGGYTDRGRAYKLLIDDEERGELKHGEGVEVEVAPGPHRVQMKLDWARSPVLEVELAEGRRAEFVCAPNASPLTAIFYSVFMRSKYIRLEQSDAPAAAGPASVE